MIVVTGGAGFIGSGIVSFLNSKGIKDIIVVDNVSETEKWKNLVGKKYIEYMHKSKFLDWLYNNEESKNVEIVIHMGACSSTTEKDFDYLYTNNYIFTKKIWKWCCDEDKRLIYASSAATYGDGSIGFDDDLKLIDSLEPLNGYGYTKHVFDLWSLEQNRKPKQYVGLKFFNVYGPNEYHKGTMASVILHAFNQIKESGQVKLFKSYKTGYSDGEQRRDFIYVKDLLKVINFLIENEKVSGIFNVGTGKARSYNDLANSVFKALNLESNIKYVDMPEKLKDKYQYFTEANITSLRKAGYTEEFYSLEDGTCDYVLNYLNKENLYL